MVKDGIFLGNRKYYRRLAQAGMADVYKGKTPCLNRFVAIKVLKRNIERTRISFVSSVQIHRQQQGF